MENNILSFHQSVASGELIDVSEVGASIGFGWPMAVAKAVHAAVARQSGGQVEDGLWELLFAARLQVLEFAHLNASAMEMDVQAVVGARRGQGIVVQAHLVVGLDETTQTPCIVLIKPASLEKPKQAAA